MQSITPIVRGNEYLAFHIEKAFSFSCRVRENFIQFPAMLTHISHGRPKTDEFLSLHRLQFEIQDHLHTSEKNQGGVLKAMLPLCSPNFQRAGYLLFNSHVSLRIRKYVCTDGRRLSDEGYISINCAMMHIHRWDTTSQINCSKTTEGMSSKFGEYSSL